MQDLKLRNPFCALAALLVLFFSAPLIQAGAIDWNFGTSPPAEFPTASWEESAVFEGFSPPVGAFADAWYTASATSVNGVFLAGDEGQIEGPILRFAIAPEPSALALFGFGALMMFLLHRSRS